MRSKGDVQMQKQTEDILQQLGIDASVAEACREFEKTYTTDDIARAMSFSFSTTRHLLKCLVVVLQRRLNNAAEPTSFLESDREFIAAESAKRSARQEEAKALAAERVVAAEKKRAEKELAR